MTSNTTIDSHGPTVAASVCLLAVIALTAAIYWQGIGAPFHFDTESNLQGLDAATEDIYTSLLFMFGGDSGPTGRPVALLSFLVNSPSWPLDRADFVRTNIFIHLINGLLVAWFTFLLIRARLGATRVAAWTAVITALIWSTSPLLQSATYLVIQRMTTLSALFVLLGLISHLKLRSLNALEPNRRLVYLSLSLVLFTTLATFTKENGALLPLMILVLEWILLARPIAIERAHWIRWKLIFLKLPALLLTVLLVSRGFYSEVWLLRREFDGFDRILTQAVVLWEYLWAALGLSPELLNPFQDNHRVYVSLFQPVAALATAAWLGLIGLAIVFRKQYAPLSFAVFWYLTAHLIESTTVPLEMVFQHRNYLPILGFAIAIPLAIFENKGFIRVVAMILATTLIVGGGARSLTMASLWGDPYRSANYWYEQNPDSDRATSFLLGQLVEQGRFDEALELSRVSESIGNSPAIYQLVQTQLACDKRYGIAPAAAPEPKAMLQNLEAARFSLSIVSSLRIMAARLDAMDCSWLNAEAMGELLDATLRNRRFSVDEAASFYLNRSRAMVAIRLQDWNDAIEHYEESLAARPNPEAAVQLTLLYIQQKEFTRGCNYLQKGHASAPRKPFLRGHWHRHTRGLFNYLSTQARNAGRTCPPWTDL